MIDQVAEDDANVAAPPQGYVRTFFSTAGYPRTKLANGTVVTGVGPQGVPGVAGAAGAQGVPGVAGAAGAQGVPGAAGTAGAQGVPGAAGTAGAAGAQGVPGAAGATGAQGAPGAAGAQGVQGAPGATGAQGATGATGAQGASAFVLGANLSASVVVSTITDALVFRLLISANTLLANDIARLRAFGRFNTTAVASTQTRRMRVTRVSSGASTVLGAVDYGNAATARTNQPCTLDMVVRIAAVGASGSFVCMGQELRPTANNATPVNAGNAVAIDTTVDNWLELWDVTNSTAATTTWDAGRLEVVR